jgi:hypothetical protein
MRSDTEPSLFRVGKSKVPEWQVESVGEGRFAAFAPLVSVGVLVGPRAMLEAWSRRKEVVSVQWSTSQCVLSWGADWVGGVRARSRQMKEVVVVVVEVEVGVM